jgi:hypothetical protein
MQDAELRSYLRQFLESAIEQDRKLKKSLIAYARSLKTQDAHYRSVCAQLDQLTSREVISEKLLAHLDSNDRPLAPVRQILGPKTGEKTRPRHQLEATVASVVPTKPRRALDGFEEQVVRTYNEEPEKWSRRFHPVSFGAANVDEIWRSGGEPKFTRKEGGIYHLIEDSGRFLVVPEPGLKLQESYFRSEGLGHLFEVANSDCGASACPIYLVSPAIVEESGERWVVNQKGELRERTFL